MSPFHGLFWQGLFTFFILIARFAWIDLFLLDFSRKNKSGRSSDLSCRCIFHNDRTHEKLAPLGIMKAQLRLPLTSSVHDYITVIYYRGLLRGLSIWDPIVPRGVSVSDENNSSPTGWADRKCVDWCIQTGKKIETGVSRYNGRSNRPP